MLFWNVRKLTIFSLNILLPVFICLLSTLCCKNIRLPKKNHYNYPGNCLQSVVRYCWMFHVSYLLNAGCIFFPLWYDSMHTSEYIGVVLWFFVGLALYLTTVLALAIVWCHNILCLFNDLVITVIKFDICIQ